MTETKLILLVDDDAQIRTMLHRYLRNEGYLIVEAESGAETLAALEQNNFGLVLLDLMLGSEDGLALARTIRARSDVPIIMLTGKDDVIDRVAGLEAGADDYVAKPFHLRELLARIRTVQRRLQTKETSPAEVPPMGTNEEVIRFARYTLDVLKRTLTAPDGMDIPLTTAEFELLRVFLRGPGRVMNREYLLNQLKGRDFEAFDRLVDTQVMRLRRKIEADPAEPELIKTVRGAGYVFAGKIGK